MKCMNNNCDNDLTGKQRAYCSDRCRKAVSRTKLDETDAQVGQVSGLEPSRTSSEMPANYGLEDCDCQMCRANRLTGNKKIVNHGEYKPIAELADNEINRVTLPGDVDYPKHNTAEHCVKCGDELPMLSKPRTYPGTCYPCVIGKEKVAV